MVLMLKSRKRRLAVEQLEDRCLLNADSVPFEQQADIDDLILVVDVRTVVIFPSSAATARSESTGQHDVVQGRYELVSEISAVGYRLTVIEQDYDGEDDPSSRSTDNDVDEIADKSPSNTASAGEGEGTGKSSKQEVATSVGNSTNLVPPARVLTIPVVTQKPDGSAMLSPTTTAVPSAAADSASLDAVRNAIAVLPHDEQYTPPKAMPDDLTDAEADLSIPAADDVSQQHLSAATLELQPVTDQTNHEQQSTTDRASVTGIVSHIVPQAGALVTASLTGSLTGDYAAIDIAMTQLLDDLEVLRSKTSTIIESLPISAWALSATAGVIAAEIIRRQRRDAESRSAQHLLDAQVALWMYPECSGLPGRTTG